MPAGRAWLLLSSEQNREHAWGFKVRATPLRWRARNEHALLSAPLACGWEALALLGEEVCSLVTTPVPLLSPPGDPPSRCCAEEAPDLK